MASPYLALAPSQASLCLNLMAIRIPCRGLDCNITSPTKSSVKCSISMLPIPLANSVWISSISYSRAHKSLIWVHNFYFLSGTTLIHTMRGLGD